MADESSSTANTTSTCPCETCPQEVTIVYLGEFQEFLEHHAINYLKLKPHITVRLKQVSGGIDALQEHLEEIDWDGSLFPAQTLGAMVESDALWDMSDYVRKSYELDWTEMLPFFRYQTARFGGQTKLIPLDGDLLSMFYRKDLFEQFNITVPRTWDEYNEASKFFHGKSLGPGGTELHGSCVARIDKCGNDYWASLILSSITQSTGTSSGFLLDPDTLNPLFGTAMEETLRLLGEQFQYGHADELTGECLASNFAFNEGHCALTYNWGNQIAISDFIYDIGVAPTPGSQRILDRATGRLVNCTASLCPHGDFYNDIGIVNQVPYSAFGGWAAGVSNASLDSKKYAAADFLAYLSNSLQSLGDVLPNPRSNFAQPYRYSHVTSSNWIDAGFDTKIASEYTETIRQINSENTAMELRVPPASALREVVDEEIFDYLLTIKESPPMTPEVALKLRQEVTVQLDTRIRGIIVAQDQSDIRASYQTSLGYTSIPENESHNYINDNFRHAGWGLGGLICFTSLFIIFWTWRYRNNKAMKAFQPFLLIQSALGLFLMGGTIIPLGFDDSWFSVDVLNITCMLIPWLYVVGFTIFFSSVYAKIRECVHIYKEPHKSHVLLVTPETALRLNMRLLFMNGIVLALWTLVDPLKWMREEVEGGLVFEDGTVETYGACRGESFSSWGFALILFALNLMICMIATLQAFKCRFLVLEYNEMQWLPLSIFPFAETWLVGGPIVVLMRDDPTILFVLLTMMIVCSSVASAMAVFAPKDWYIRKVKYLDSSPKQKKKKGFPERTSSAGILVLKHPTVSLLFHIAGLYL